MSDIASNGEPSGSGVMEDKRPSSPDSQSNETSKLVKRTTFAPNVIIKESPPPAYIDISDDDEVDHRKHVTIDVEVANRFNVEAVGTQSPTSPSSPSSPTHDTVTSNQLTTDFLQPNSVYYHNTNPVPRPPIDSVGYRNKPTGGGQDKAELLDSQESPLKFGWIVGVLVRCVLNIWGVMLFLRLSFIVGQAGIGFTLLIILLSSVVTLITTSSMSAICTNGQVRGGGAYYLISRSLGPEFGGAIGLIFSLANAIAVAMYVVGFSETVAELIHAQGATFTGDAVNDVRVIGAITMVLLVGITQLGMAWESKAQLVLLVVLLISIVNFLIGTFIPASDYKKSYGYFSYSSAVFKENLGPQFRNKESFFSMFSIFFPAATGILAGCNISGDLKDAQKAIPKGTFLAILITSVTYMVIAVILGSIEVRDASGLLSDFIGINNATELNCTTAACQNGWMYTPSSATCKLDASAADKCFTGGLLNDYQAMQKISLVSYIIVAGIFAATLSSALASLVSAPKIFQAVCKDEIFPVFNWFAKGAKKTDEPKRAYVLAFFISLACVLIGELNVIAPIISNFFLASYTLINYSCFSSSLSKSPGWRPAYKYYNMWLSLFGAFVCCAIMFVIQWWAALITIVIVIVIYKYVDYKSPNINWGSSTQAIVYKQALNQTLKLNSVEDHVRNFRPQLLVLTGCPSHRPALLHLASSITRNTSLMICGNIKINERKFPFDEVQAEQNYLNNEKCKAFYTCVTAPSFGVGINSLMQVAGLGKMKTNTLLLGFKTNWQKVTGPELTNYAQMIRKAFDMRFGVCVLRMERGMDISEFLQEEHTEMNLNLATATAVVGGSDADAVNRMESGNNQKVTFAIDQEQVRINMKDATASNKDFSDNNAKIQAIRHFQNKQKGKTIDVWWLTEDGGLTVLLPHIISQRAQWAGCSLRIFTMKNIKSDANDFSMARLISKFRIDCEDINIIDDLKTEKPSDAAVESFYDMIKPYQKKNLGDVDFEPWMITEEEIEKKKEKTLRFIRLQELLQKHSKDAALVFMTLPLPKDIKSSALYLAWLEEITKNLPPIVLIRGNQTSVLTFYS